jgi:hypothetical protein
MSVIVGTKLPRYPWDEWLARRKKNARTVLVKGRDYKCQTQSMTVQIRGAAIKRGRYVSLHVEEGRRIATITITINGKR